ncbi:S1 family peptidase [Methylobacillus arboreus]|uniref:S1 family peptidase n=1 Tax=Methylobacillus arboreus TaxID=755170 RepID=UPI001E4E0CD8|nr:S1 family peptidase [Methylobacillus arboreus]MCB5191285.1 S1 family peptidase [Methylobacillus arboreus]
MGMLHSVTGFCVAFGLLAWTVPAGALMYGQPVNEAPAVQLVFEHRHWHEYRQEWRVDHSECSAVVVGGAPLTVLTAAHCLRDVSLDQASGLPVVRVARASHPLFLKARLRQAIFPEFDKVRGNLIDDLAVLVFDMSLPDSIAVAPVLLDQPAHSVLLCGYGHGAADSSPADLGCANKEVHAGTDTFAEFVPDAYAALDPVFYARYQVQFESKASVVSALEALLAVNRLNEMGSYDPALPMPTLGDSGGPWLEDIGEGRFGVVGITSFVESFYGSSPQWPFFRQSSAPLADFVYAAYGIRLDSMRARKLFNAARLKGADIRVYRRGWKDEGVYASPASTEIRR